MVCSTVVLHAKCNLQPVLCFYCAVGPTTGTTDSPGLLRHDLCPSLYPFFLYFEPYSDPLPPRPPPPPGSETGGAPAQPRPRPSMVVRNPFLPSLPHPALILQAKIGCISFFVRCHICYYNQVLVALGFFSVAIFFLATNYWL
jgi:hypothetical protein